MRVARPFDANARAGVKALAALPRRCEKPSGSSALQDEEGNPGEAGHKPAPPLQIELVCQEETRGCDPFWDGPVLTPTFVAQVMGQAMFERRHPGISVETAYGSAAPRKALLLDRKS